MSKELPTWCCASGCKHCDAWAAREAQNEQPSAEWCELCAATTYRDAANRCEPCKEAQP